MKRLVMGCAYHGYIAEDMVNRWIIVTLTIVDLGAQ